MREWTQARDSGRFVGDVVAEWLPTDHEALTWPLRLFWALLLATPAVAVSDWIGVGFALAFGWIFGASYGHRDMRLVAEFRYVGPDAVHWVAPAGHVVNGASVPWVFRRVAGPLEGPWRSASVIHDVACDLRDRDWRAVHRMFYDACRAGGTPVWLAFVLWAAVRLFGPRWECGQ